MPADRSPDVIRDTMVRTTALLTALASALVGGAATLPTAAQAAPDVRPVDAVNPFVGTDAGQSDFGTGGGAGNTYPGAQAPFGMLAWSPDTYPGTVAYAGGYSHVDEQVKGFSLTHMSGAGCSTFGDVPILPIAVPMTTSPARPFSFALAPEYRTTLDHRHESASPGYYSARLNPGTDKAIDSRLTADTRSGLGVFDFPATSDAGFLINASGSLMASSAADVTIHPAKRLVTGSVTSGRFCFTDTEYTVYFAIKFDRAFSRHGTWRRQAYSPGSTSASDVSLVAANYSPVPGGPQQMPNDPSGSAQTGAYVGFDARDARRVKMQVGISYVDSAGALANLESEQEGWDLGDARAQTSRRWARLLDRVDVESSDPERARVFYTALYHALVTPNVFSDVDGRYLGMDDVVRTSRRTRYANFSGWDVYRTQFPLLAMLYPKVASDIAQSLVAQAEQYGWMPKWSYANRNTPVMAGDPALPALASMHALGARRFDVATAVEIGHKGATDPSQLLNPAYVVRPGILDYTNLGYVSAENDSHSPVPAVLMPELVWGSAATTLEYAVADDSLAKLARLAGDDDVAAAARARARNWRNLFNPATGYVEPRSATGLFQPGYDVAAGDGFVEGNSAQYTWFVPHDTRGLIELMGGRAAALARLDDYFTELNAGPAAPYAFLGNEPSLGHPWIYAWLGKPTRTQDILRRALTGLYADEPGGLPGNDDLGTMSAWYVLASIGLYPAIPGTDELLVTAPQFDRVVLRLPEGRVNLVVDDACPACRPAAKRYVERLRVDGTDHRATSVRWSRLRRGATLTFEVTDDQSSSWGTRPQDAPRH